MVRSTEGRKYTRRTHDLQLDLETSVIESGPEPQRSRWSPTQPDRHAPEPEGSQLSKPVGSGSRQFAIFGCIAFAIVVLVLVLVESAHSASRSEAEVSSSTAASAGASGGAQPDAISVALRDRQKVWHFSNRNGYEFELKLFMSDPIGFDLVRGKSHPGENALVVGGQCGDGPQFQESAVVVGRVETTAKTNGFPTPIKVRIPMTFEAYDPPAGSGQHDVEIAEQFTGNASCTNLDNTQYGDFGISYSQNTPIPSGSTSSHPFFIIIHKYFAYDSAGDPYFLRNTFLRPTWPRRGSGGKTANDYDTDDQDKVSIIP